MAQGLAVHAWAVPCVHRTAAPISRPASRSLTLARPTRSLRHLAASAAALDGTEVEEPFELEPEFEDPDTPSTGLSTQQVSNVLSMLCEETDIMQIELKMGDFELFAQRSIKGAAASSPAASYSQSIAANPAFTPPAATPGMNMGQAQPPSFNPTQSVMTVDEEVNETMVMIESPKVGVFRRGRYAKGKRIGKGNVCEPGDEVKKGQTLAYVEQLGTFVPVESPQAGQIATFSCEEGESVEYKQHVVELAPFFGGHIIGESKWN